MTKVKTHPLAEVIARKLSGLTGVPKSEQTKMINMAIHAAVEWHDRRVKKMAMTLNRIANEFMTTEEIANDCENVGLTYEEYLEMSYENIQAAAQAAVSEGEK